MQNKFKGFRNFFKGKGYYIALLLCTAVVGVTGYYLLTEKEGATVPTSESTTATTPTPGSTGESQRQEPDKPVASLGGEEEVSSEKPTVPSPFILKKPVAGDVLSKLAVDHLAYNETTRDWRTHEGMDLAANLGDAVYAAAEGTVYTIYEDEHLGMTVVLHHNNGYSTHYANLAPDIPVSVGDRLQAGDPVGNVGQSACTENATQPHVHFALYQNNEILDPADFLP